MMKKILPIIVAILSLTNGVFAAPAIYETTSYYKINGDSGAALRTELNTLGPFITDRRYSGETTWYIYWQYNYDTSSPQSCAPKNITVSVTVTTILPEWENEESADENLQEKWDKYIENLTIHESGHGENGKKAAAEIETALISNPPMPDCGSLKTTLDATAHDIIKKHNDWDSNYDEETQHGKTQGAYFP